MPALVALAGAMTLFMAALILTGMLYGYRYSIGALTGALVNLLKNVHIHIPGVGDVYFLRFLADALHWLDSGMQGYMEAGITWSEDGLIWCFQGSADLAAWVSYEVQAGTGDTLGALKRIGVNLPHLKWLKLLKWLIGFTSVIGLGLGIFKKLRLHWLTQYLSLHALGHGLLKALNLAWLMQYANPVALVTSAFPIALEHWTGFTWKQLRHYLRRLRILGYLSPFATLVALGNGILKKLNLSWLKSYASVGALVAAGLAVLDLTFGRCENTKSAGKNLCAMDASLLENLLFDSLLIASLFSIREFTHELQDITGESVSIMRALIKEF